MLFTLYPNYVDSYTYSVSSSTGLAQDAFTELVTQIN